MFSRARIRLTAWYVAALTGFVVVLGAAGYLVERHQLQSNVNHGLMATAARADSEYRRSGLPGIYNMPYGPSYVVTVTDGTPGSGQRAPDRASALAALATGFDMRTVSGSGGDIRVLSLRLEPKIVVQVSRSLEPEEEALGRLLVLLLLGGAATLVVATVGGWFLAGKSLAPMRQAFRSEEHT